MILKALWYHTKECLAPYRIADSIWVAKKESSRVGPAWTPLFMAINRLFVYSSVGI